MGMCFSSAHSLAFPKSMGGRQVDLDLGVLFLCFHMFSMKINSDNCSSIAKAGLFSTILCTLHRGDGGADLEFNYLPKSSAAGRGA